MVSVIIPSYNHGTALPKCLDSLRTQSFKDFEIIVVDDGSLDNTQSIVEKYIKTRASYSQIQYCRISHSGAPAARNAGAKMARGEYLLFADADLILNKDALQKLLNVLRANPQAGYAYSGFKFG